MSVPIATRLTKRERQVLVLVAEGRRDWEIAGELGLADETVRTHVRNALRKLDARNRPQGVAKALAAGEISAY